MAVRAGMVRVAGAELRTVETILDGKLATPFLQPGDRSRIWMDEAGHSIFDALGG